MKRMIAATAVLSVLAISASAAEVPQTCAQIRERIEARSGVQPAIDIDLLRTLSLRQECRFSAAEAYRAAYGDTPPVAPIALASRPADWHFD